MENRECDLCPETLESSPSGTIVASATIATRAESVPSHQDAPGIWTPDPLFDELIKNGRLFANLNR